MSQTTLIPFVVALHNSSDETTAIENVSVEVVQKTLISRTADRAPIRFDYSVVFEAGHPTQITAGEKGVACGFLRWTLPAEPSPMLAIVRCSFTVDYDEQQVETEPITLVLQSREGVLESQGEEDSVVARDQAAKIVVTLTAFPRRRSEGFESLLRQLEIIDAES